VQAKKMKSVTINLILLQESQLPLFSINKGKKKFGLKLEMKAKENFSTKMC